MPEKQPRELPDREDFLAQMEKDVPLEPREDEPEEPDDSEPSAQDIADGEAEAEADPDENEVQDTEVEEKDSPKPEPKPEPEVSKKLEAINRAERRAKEAVAAARQELEERRAKVEGELKELSEFKALKSKARYDLPGVLRALGVKDEEFESASKVIYAHSKKGAEKPELREAAAREMRARVAEDKLDSALRRIDELNEKLETREKQAAVQAKIEEYVGTVVAHVEKANAPLVQAQMKKNPKKARAALEAEADRLARETGEVPLPDEVVASLEKRRREDLEESGVDVAALAKKPTQKAQERSGSRTLTGIGTRTAPQAQNQDRDSLRREVLRDLKTGQFR